MLNDTISQPTSHGSVLSEPGKPLESRSRLLQLTAEPRLTQQKPLACAVDKASLTSVTVAVTSVIVTISHFVRVAGC